MMTEMIDQELADVNGQAYVLTVGEAEFHFKSLDERTVNPRIDAAVDRFFARHPRSIARLRDGSAMVVPRILGAISDRAGIDLGEIKFAYVPPVSTP